MRLELQNVSKKVGADAHLYPMSVSLVPGAINVILGTTLAGKTSLMRLMAGLDYPPALLGSSHGLFLNSTSVELIAIDWRKVIVCRKQPDMAALA